MKSLNVWILQTGEPLHIDGANARPMRAMNLSNALVQAGHKVVLWSAAFNHIEKRQRDTRQLSIRVSNSLEIRLIPSSGYQRNISLRRLIDHAQLAINLKKMLKQCKELPDVAFIGYPPIEIAAVMVRWLSRHGTPTLLDVKDQWPSIFLEAMPSFMRPMGHIILWPYFQLAKRTMQGATGISAMAYGFLGWALNFAGHQRTDSDGVFPLTSQMDQVSDSELEKARQWWADQGILDDGTIRICYVGNHTPHLDLSPVRDTASLFIEQKLPVEFIIAGNGISSSEFKKMMSGLPNVHFPGHIDRPKFIALAGCAHASIIPYINSVNFQLSLPNKTFDSLALGLPILSPLQGEVASLITRNGVGMRYGTDTGKSLYDCILALTQNVALQKSMSQKARTLYSEQFSFEMVYGELVKHLEKLAEKSLVQRYAFYSASSDILKSQQANLRSSYYMEIWTPKLFSIAPKELMTSTFAVWWLFHWVQIFKNQNYSIYLVYTEDRKLAHYTVLLPAHFRFPFMHDGDLQIGPVGTNEHYRRNGLAHYILSLILKEYENKEMRLWYIAREENEPSKRLIEKVNFIKVGEGIKIKKGYTKLLSKFYITKKTLSD